MIKQLESKESVELAIRGAVIAREALRLTECSCAFVARAYFVEVIKQIKELDGIITRLEKEGK